MSFVHNSRYLALTGLLVYSRYLSYLLKTSWMSGKISWNISDEKNIHEPLQH